MSSNSYRQAVAMASVAAFLLAACGGGGTDAANPPPPPNPLTGMFIAGGIQGLRYQTPTQAGFTDAAGTFSYLPGEAVTFSLGGITFGTAPGAAQMSPFSLSGISPPDSEVALRSQLATIHDITAFDHAANVMYVLYALDVDRNGANGIDLTGLHSRLSDAQLDFDMPLYKFSALFNDKHTHLLGLHREIPVEAPLVHLYSALGIVIPLQAESIAERTIEGSDHLSYEFVQYDAVGQILARLDDGNANGIAESGRTFTWSGGLQTSITHHQDYDENGAPERIQAYSATRSAWGGYLTYSIIDDHEADGVPEQRFDYLYTYDAAGVRQRMVHTSDWNGDGALESRRTVTYVLDTRGNLAMSTEDFDLHDDGTVDERTIHRYSHDARNNLLSETLEMDFEADGDINFSSATNYTYDAAGNRLTRVRDGSRDTYTYDANGNVLSILTESSFENGVPQVLESRTATYDANNNLLTLVHEGHDSDGLDFAETHVLTYDTDGKLLTHVHRRDSDGNGEWNTTDTFSYSYGANGERVSEAETNLASDPPGETSHVVYTHAAPLANGVLYLIRHYQQDANYLSPHWWMF